MILKAVLRILQFYRKLQKLQISRVLAILSQLFSLCYGNNNTSFKRCCRYAFFISKVRRVNFDCNKGKYAVTRATRETWYEYDAEGVHLSLGLNLGHYITQQLRLTQSKFTVKLFCRIILLAKCAVSISDSENCNIFDPSYFAREAIDAKFVLGKYLW